MSHGAVYGDEVGQVATHPGLDGNIDQNRTMTDLTDLNQLVTTVTNSCPSVVQPWSTPIVGQLCPTPIDRFDNFRAPGTVLYERFSTEWQ